MATPTASDLLTNPEWVAVQVAAFPMLADRPDYLKERAEEQAERAALALGYPADFAHALATGTEQEYYERTEAEYLRLIRSPREQFRECRRALRANEAPNFPINYRIATRVFAKA